MFNANNRIKYPKTMHLPWSPGLQNDDRVIESLDGFKDKRIVVTEKMDGENTTMYRDAIHARSLDLTMTHPSRNWVRAFHGSIKHEIPEGWRICGENLYAVHSIKYSNLSSYFMLFSIWNDKNECLSWEETKEWAALLGVETVPVAFEGKWEEFYDIARIGGGWRPVSTFGEVEGYVVRTEHGFHYDDFHKYMAKYVRKGHVQTDQHWMNKPVEPNGIKKEIDNESPVKERVAY